MRIRVYLDGMCLKTMRFKETKKNDQAYLVIRYYLSRGYFIKRARSNSRLKIAVIVLRKAEA